MLRRETKLIYGLYFATYMTANVIDTVCEQIKKDSQLSKFIGTTLVNVSLCVTKDRECSV